MFNVKCFFSYHMRRVECPQCGVKVEKIPWAKGKSHLTTSYQLFLACWAKRLSWEETARIFKTSWDSVYRSVKYVANYGLKHRILSNIEAIGVDEVQYEEGQHYMTIVYEIGEKGKRLLYVAKDRTVESLVGFFQEIGSQCSNNIKFVCSDMWQPFLNAIKEKIPQALHILDRFHIVANLNKYLDQVRREEVAELKSQGYENPLTHTRYCLLKKPENLTFSQAKKLKYILKYKLKTTRAYLLKDSFQFFWVYTSPYWARCFLHKWYARAMRSRLKPIQKFAKSVRKHEDLILNWFEAKKAYSSGIVEGLNLKVNLVIRTSYGFKNFEILKLALFHSMGNLVEPGPTHGFC